MMKKMLALLAVSMLVLSGCTWLQPAEEPAPAIESDDTMMDEAEIGAGGPEGPSVYENTKYGFSLTFPNDWGTVEENDSGNRLEISSEDGSKNLTMLFISVDATGGAAVMDAPAEILGVNYKYTLYREANQGIDILEAQGEDVSEEKAFEAELDDIFMTLQLLDEDGEVIIDGGGGVAPDEDPSTYPPAPEV